MRPRGQQLRHRVVRGDERAGDAGRARAAVGLDHVAVDVQRARAELFEIEHRAQRAADQTLDFLGAAGLFAARSFAIVAGVGRARQHAVFGCEPALAAVAQETGHRLGDARRADHFGVAEFDQHRALRMLRVVARDAHVAQLIGAGGRWGVAWCWSCSGIGQGENAGGKTAILPPIALARELSGGSAMGAGMPCGVAPCTGSRMNRTSRQKWDNAGSPPRVSYIAGRFDSLAIAASGMATIARHTMIYSMTGYASATRELVSGYRHRRRERIGGTAHGELALSRSELPHARRRARLRADVARNADEQALARQGRYSYQSAAQRTVSQRRRAQSRCAQRNSRCSNARC